MCQWRQRRQPIKWLQRRITAKNEKAPAGPGLWTHPVSHASFVESRHSIAIGIRVTGRCVGLDLQGMAIFSVSASRAAIRRLRFVV